MHSNCTRSASKLSNTIHLCIRELRHNISRIFSYHIHMGCLLIIWLAGICLNARVALCDIAKSMFVPWERNIKSLKRSHNSYCVIHVHMLQLVDRKGEYYNCLAGITFYLTCHGEIKNMALLFYYRTTLWLSSGHPMLVVTPNEWIFNISIYVIIAWLLLHFTRYTLKFVQYFSHDLCNTLQTFIHT